MPSLDVIVFPGFMLRVSVKHMIFGLKVKGKLISLMFSGSLGKPTNVTSDRIDMLGSFVLQLYGSRHGELGASLLDKFKKSIDSDLCLLPPIKKALCQHIDCASYQPGYLWSL